MPIRAVVSRSSQRNGQSLKVGLAGEGFWKEVEFKLDSGRTTQKQAGWRTGISEGAVSRVNMNLTTPESHCFPPDPGHRYLLPILL